MFSVRKFLRPSSQKMYGWRKVLPTKRRFFRLLPILRERWSISNSPTRCWTVSKKTGLPIAVKMRHDFHYVDELSSRSGAPVGRMIPIERLETNPEQPRHAVGDLSDLTASILEKGVLEPILVRHIRETNQFMIISGERRYRASLAAGLRELPCIEKDVDDAEVAEIALIENLQRKDLTAFEEAEGLQSLIDRFGYTHEQIAKKIGKARSSVTETLSLNTLPDEIKQLCREAQVISKSMLLQIVRQPSREKMRELIRRFAQGEVSRDEARKIGRAHV